MIPDPIRNFKSYVTIIVIIITLQQIKVSTPLSRSEAEAQEFIRSVRLGHLGGITSHSYCPQANTYMIGARIRTSVSTVVVSSTDDAASASAPVINMIEFLCGDQISSRSHPASPLELDGKTGSWGEMRECPNGQFVTGIVFHLQSVSSKAFAPTRETPGTPKLENAFTIFQMTKARYISGLTLNCSYGNEVRRGGQPSSVTLGQTGIATVTLTCLNRRVMVGVGVEVESVISLIGERTIPVRVKVGCRGLTHPAQYCTPEIGWEKVEARNVKCRRRPSSDEILIASQIGIPSSSSGNKSTTPTPAATVCEVEHIVGASLNKAITNLNKIVSAYELLRLDNGPRLGYLISRILRNPKLRQGWSTVHNLAQSDYDKIMAGLTVDKYSNTRKGLSTIKFNNNGTLLLLQPHHHQTYNNRRQPLNNKSHYGKETTSEVKSELVVNQLVGYCSVFKMYFPVLRARYERYLMEEIEGIKTRVVFDENK